MTAKSKSTWGGNQIFDLRGDFDCGDSMGSESLFQGMKMQSNFGGKHGCEEHPKKEDECEGTFGGQMEKPIGLIPSYQRLLK